MIDAQSVLINMSQSYPGVIRLILSCSFIMGIAFVVGGIYKLKIYGELRTMMASQTSLKEPIASFIVAAVFLYMPTAVRVMLNTTFGYQQLRPLSYVSAEAGGFEMGMHAILGLVQIVGLISFIRGWYILHSAAQQGRQGVTFGKGLTHIIGGIMGMNIAGTKEVIWNTFGFV